MNKKKFVVLALMMIAIIALSSCMLVACNDNSDNNGGDSNNTTETVKETEGLLIKNGDFKVIDSNVTTYPRSVTGWTGAKMFSSGSYKSDVTAGVISLDKALYDANKSKWDDQQDALYNLLVAGGRYANREYKHSLMVYMPEEGKDSDGKTIHGPTAYGYTSTSFTLEKGGYYRLSVDVLTHNIGGSNEAERGARIYVSSNTYAEIKGIDTNDTWKTYQVVIEASAVSSTSLNVMLGLGRATSADQSGLSTGYAVFDNLSLERIEEKGSEVYAQAVADELKNQNEGKDKSVTTATLKVPNGRFDFGSITVGSSGAPNGWALVAGNSGKDDVAPTEYRYNGIINLKNFAEDYGSYSLSYSLGDLKDYKPADMLVNIKDSIFTTGKAQSVIGSNVFMMSQQYLTAQSIKSSRTITIERNKMYALSVDLFAYNIHGAGVSLVLTGNDGKDIVIKGICSNPSNDFLVGEKAVDVDNDTPANPQDPTVAGKGMTGWTTYTFYIKGNQFKNYSYNMSIWLGTEGKNSNTSGVYTYKNTSGSTSKKTVYNANGTFSSGWVFVDELNLNELENSQFPTDGANADQTLDCSGNDTLTSIVVDLTTTNMLADMLESDTNKSSMDGVVESLGSGVPSGWSSKYDTSKATNPIIDGIISDGVVSIENEERFLDTTGGKGTYPDKPYEILNPVAYMMHASSESYYEVETNTITIEKNKYYRISLWVKTQDVKSTSGAYVYVLKKNGADEDDTTLATFSKINTTDYDKYQNDWCELTVAITGANDRDVKIAFKFALGTGTRWTASTLAKGSLFVTNINGSEVSHSTYSSTSTGTYSKAIDLSSSLSYAFKNGSFDSYDLDDKNLEEGKGLEDQNVAATPSDWTISDNKLGANTTDSNLVAGVIKFNTTDGLSFTASNQANAAFGNTIDFNGFYPSVDKTTSADVLGSLPGNKGHVLAIGNNSASSKGYAVGFASSSVTLSSNTYYRISVYAKTVGETKANIYLSGESSLTSGVSSFTITGNGTKWTKYTFYIEVGQASVSTKLNLWLGDNVDYTDIEVTDAEIEAERAANPDYDANTEVNVIKKAIKAKKAASKGNVFFDNVYYTSIDESDYNEAVESESNNVHKLSFLTDSFDALSSSVESRGSLSTPNGWTGTTGTNQSSSNTKSGIIYAAGGYYEVKNINGVEYVGILGDDYKLEDIKVSDKEYEEEKDKDEYKDLPDKEAVVEAIQKAKLAKLQVENWIPVNELYAHSGNQMLVINNMKKSAYTYSGSSVTMKEQSYYEVSVFVRTYGLNSDEKTGAYIELYLGSSNEVDNPLIFEAVRADQFTEYKFYVQTLNEDVTSVSLKLSLGKYISNVVDGEDVVTGLTNGYAMFDDVTIKKVTEEDFAAATASETVKKRTVTSENKGTADDDKDNNDNNSAPSRTFNTEALWWMIPTIVLGLLIIIVVIIYVVRKVRKPIAKKKEKKVATPVETPSLDVKHDKYDDNKE